MNQKSILILSFSDLKERGFVLPLTVCSAFGYLYHIDEFEEQDNGIAEFMDLNNATYMLVPCEGEAQKREVVVNFTLNDATGLMEDAQKSESKDMVQEFDVWTFKASDGKDIDVTITTGSDYKDEK